MRELILMTVTVAIAGYTTTHPHDAFEVFSLLSLLYMQTPLKHRQATRAMLVHELLSEHCMLGPPFADLARCIFEKGKRGSKGGLKRENNV